MVYKRSAGKQVIGENADGNTMYFGVSNTSVT